MRLYEYEGKRVFSRYGLGVPPGIVIGRHNLRDLHKACYPVVIKAQSFAGGRGKAGLIQPASNREEAEQRILELLDKAHAGFPVNSVLVEPRVDIEREMYLAFVVDRLGHRILCMACEHGGVDIEEIAKKEPTSILKYYFDPGALLHSFTARNIASSIGLRGPLLSQGASVVERLYRVFVGFDCKVAEINPLVLTRDGRLLCLDAKVDLDEDAMFRHPELREMSIFARHEVGELTEREEIAKRAGIPYVDLGGDIGVFPGGAGFGIASIDLIEHYGGKPANFMDSGGAPTQEKLRAMLGLLLDNPRVKAIFGARFGGISRCDDWAKAVVQFVIENKPAKPMIMRMAGNMEAEGRKIIEQAKSEHATLFSKVKIYAYDTPIEEVIQETIRAARAEP